MLQCIKPYACLPPNTTNFKAFFITDWKLTTSFINTPPFSIQSSQRTWQNTHTCMHTLCNDPSMVPNTSWAYIYTRVQGLGFLVSGVRPLMLFSLHSQLQTGKAGVKLRKVRLGMVLVRPAFNPHFGCIWKEIFVFPSTPAPFPDSDFLNWQEKPRNNPLYKLQGCVAFKETQGYAISHTPTQDVWALLLILIGSELHLSCYPPHMGTSYRCNCHSTRVCRMPGTMLWGLCEVL